MVLRSLNSRVASLFLPIMLLAAGCNPLGESSIDNNFGSQPRSDAGATSASLAFSPTSKAFGTAAVGSTTAQSVTITNTGGSSATNAYIAVTGTGFSLSNNNCGTLVTAITVAAWGSCTFDIVFAPSVSGAAAGSVTLSYDDGTTAQNTDMAVSGTGVNLASLSFAPTLKAFGNVTVGAGSTQSFTLSNSGVVAATDVYITISGTDYALANNTCGTSISTVTVGAAGNCTFDVIFTPGSVGAASGTVSLSYNDGSAVVVTPSVALTGTGISPGSLAFSPTSKAFGNVFVGASSTAQSFTVTNSGATAATNVYLALTTGTQYAVSGSNCGTSVSKVSVAAGATCTFDATFTPTTSGAKSDTLTITYDNGAATAQTQTASLTGTGLAVASLAFSPTSKAFGNVTENTSSAAQTFTVTNSGDSSATNVYLALTTGTQYAISNSTCGTSGSKISVAASSTCTFDVTFSPTSTGAKSDTLTITYDNGVATAQTQTAALTGTGVGSSFSASWTFASSAAYTYDSTFLEFVGSVCRLKAIGQSDSDNTSSGFGGGTSVGIGWDSGNSWMAVGITPFTTYELPNNRSAAGWQDMTDNVLLMHLNESASSTTFTDSSGLNVVATCSTCPTTGVLSKQNFGIYSATGSEKITLSNATAPNISSYANWTIMAWVKPHTYSSGYPTFYSFGHWGATLGMEAGTGKVHSYINDSNYAASTASLALNTWSHVALVYNGTNRIFYINGSQNGALGTAPAVNASAIASAIGGVGDAAASPNSEIDEVAIFNRALSAAEISAVYTTQNQSFSKTFTSRVFDAGGSVAWSSLAWTPQSPVMKPLPNSASSETVYSSGNANMTGNVLLMHLDDAAAATTFTENSGSTVTATCGGGTCPTMESSGRFSTGGRFNVSQITLTKKAAIDLSTHAAWTISAWVKMASLAGSYPAIYSYGYWGASLGMSDGYLDSWINNGNQITGATKLTVGPWYHAALVYNGTNRIIYLNGKADKTGSAPVVSSSAMDSAIGGVPTYTPSFNGYIDEVSVFSRALSEVEVLDHYKRGILSLKHQVRSCSSSCTNETYIGPDGTNATYYSEETNLAITAPSVTLAGVSSNRYFQYKTYFDTEDSLYLPYLKSVTVGPAHYGAGSPTLTNNTGVSYSSISSFANTLGAGNAGTVTYQISKNGTTWYYYNGATWTTATTSAHTNSAAVINTNVATIGSVIGTGTFYYKAFFNSDGTQQVELQQVDVDGL